MIVKMYIFDSIIFVLFFSIFMNQEPVQTIHVWLKIYNIRLRLFNLNV